MTIIHCDGCGRKVEKPSSVIIRKFGSQSRTFDVCTLCQDRFIDILTHMDFANKTISDVKITIYPREEE